jgi:hypothetical protein
MRLQPQPITPIEPDTPLTVSLDTSGAVVIHYSSEGDETVWISAKAISTEDAFPLDTVIEVVSPSGERLAYNDDYFPALVSESVVSELELQPTDSAISFLTLTDAGDYQLRVNSFNGVSTGEVEVLLQRAEAVALETRETDADVFAASVTLQPNQVAQLDIPLEAGRAYTITVRDPLGGLDAVVQIIDVNGTVLASNDDHGTDDFTLNIFDSRIAEFTPETSGDHTLSIRDYLGRGGVFEVEVRSADEG